MAEARSMTIPGTEMALEGLIDHMAMDVQFVDRDGFLRYMNKTAAAKPANVKRQVGVNIRDCHTLPESLKMIERIFEDFKKGRREPHHYITQTGRVALKVPVCDAEGNFIGVLAYSYPAGMPQPERTF